MCSFAGIINFKKNLFTYEAYNRLFVRDIVGSLSKNDVNEWVGEHAAFAQINNSKNILLPLKKTVEGHEFVIIFIGKLDNNKDLRKELSKFDYLFTTSFDAETVLYSYIHYGENCSKKLSGNFCFCIWDSMRQQVFICTDSSGKKPIFYATIDNSIIFSSDIDSLFRYPDFKPKIDKYSLCEIFSHFPYKSVDENIFKDVYELTSATQVTIKRSGIFKKQYCEPQKITNPDIDIKSRINILKPIIAQTLNLEEYLQSKDTYLLPMYKKTDISATREMLIKIFDDKTSPINVFIDRENALNHPELMEFIIELNNWFNEYNPIIV